MKRLFSVILLLVLFFTMAVPVHADGFTGTVDNMTIVTQNSISAVVDEYFSNREEFLRDCTLMTFDTANNGVIIDETRHREVLYDLGVTVASSEVSVNNVYATNLFVDVSATETIVYSQSGSLYTDTIMHEIVVYIKNETNAYVICDSYIEPFSGFSSCSYVSPSIDICSVDSDVDGSKHCLIHVAKSELGNTYTENNKFTQYTCGYTTPWCACFISWCGNQANIPTTIIPKGETVDYMAYHANYADGVGNGGYRTPQVGDLVVWEDYSHIGIVSSVNSTNQTFSVIHGNWDDQVVQWHGLAYTDSRFEGFCRPQYTTYNHTYAYYSTDAYHVGTCDNCGSSTGRTEHVYLYAGDHIYICICGRAQD